MKSAFASAVCSALLLACLCAPAAAQATQPNASEAAATATPDLSGLDLASLRTLCGNLYRKLSEADAIREAETRRLQKQIAALTADNAKLRALVASQTQPKAGAPGAGAASADPNRWRTAPVRNGMTLDEMIGIFGKPDRSIASDESTMYFWRFTETVNHGNGKYTDEQVRRITAIIKDGKVFSYTDMK